MKKALLAASLLAALVLVGAASAYTLSRTVFLAPGHCKKVHGTKVCARKVKPKIITVSPSPIGRTFSGSGSETLPPLTIPAHGDTVTWTSQPYNDGAGGVFNVFGASCGDKAFDNGGSTNGSTSGSSFLPAGTYTCDITADDGGWTIKF